MIIGNDDVNDYDGDNDDYDGDNDDDDDDDDSSRCWYMIW